MSKTDRQTDKDKTTRWAFTVFEPQWGLFKEMPGVVAEWGWQTEICPDTQRPHYQGYIRTRKQLRIKVKGGNELIKALPGVHINPAREWFKLLSYCKKTDTAVEGTQVHEVGVPERKYLKFHEALMRIANAYVHIPGNDDDDNYRSAVRTLMVANEEDVSLYSNPQLQRAWNMTSPYWLRKVYHLLPDGCELAFCEWCDYHDALAYQEANVPEVILSCCSIADEGQEG